MREGFVITAINGQAMKKPEEVEKILQNLSGRVRIEGINKNNIKGYYSFYF
jgi:type II secretory pathway component PulC